MILQERDAPGARTWTPAEAGRKLPHQCLGDFVLIKSLQRGSRTEDSENWKGPGAGLRLTLLQARAPAGPGEMGSGDAGKWAWERLEVKLPSFWAYEGLSWPSSAELGVCTQRPRTVAGAVSSGGLPGLFQRSRALQDRWTALPRGCGDSGEGRQPIMRSWPRSAGSGHES